MNQFVRRSLSYLPKRIAEPIKKMRARAQKRQDAWMKRREAEIKEIRKASFAFRDKAIDFIGDWVEIEGVTKKSDLEVRPHKTDWAVFEKGKFGGPLHIYSKKTEALEEAKRLAKTRGSQVKVFTKQGTVQNTYTFQSA